ncbi:MULTISPECIES: hypothetical protein [Haloferax]|uniref:Uncharacterized protein n=2 Tax=Haloferax TaxID=2251 RepID=A0A6G1YYR4_9EURY|nr:MULTISPECIES: hypothetical protein [Haloferax]KAB1186840.1 hypothetical protein Hfx1149_01880 [Haloferax sp. CBA1149]MRW79469.1 hypothetical protein [Haloferax marinisediminis]
MGLLLELLGHIFTGAIEIFVIDEALDQKTAKRQLWVARLAAASITVVSAALVWTAASPLRWVGAVVGLLAVVYGLVAELRYR